MSTLYSIVHSLNVLGEPDLAADYIVMEDVSTGLMKRVLPDVLLGTFQASDDDLADIAALTPVNDDIMQRKAGEWVNRTLAQVKADLHTAGLVDNTSIETIAGAKTFSDPAIFSQTLAVTGTAAFAAKMTAAKGIIATPIVLTPSAAISLNAALGDTFTLTVGHTGTLAATGLTAGQTITLIVTAVGTTYTITFSTNIKTGTATLVTGAVAGKQFVITYYCDGVNLIEKNRTAAL